MVHARLPNATACDREAGTEARRLIAGALNAPDAAKGVYDRAGRSGAPISLKEIGMPQDGLERAATLATANP